MKMLIAVNLAFALGLAAMLIAKVTNNYYWLGFLGAWCVFEVDLMAYTQKAPLFDFIQDQVILITMGTGSHTGFSTVVNEGTHHEDEVMMVISAIRPDKTCEGFWGAQKIVCFYKNSNSEKNRP